MRRHENLIIFPTLPVIFLMRNFYLLTAVMLIAVSCYTATLPLSVLEPAVVNLPAEIRKVSIFPAAGFITDKHKIDSLDDIKLTPKADAGQILIGYLDGIYDILVVSPRFDRVIFSDSSYGKFMQDGHLYWDDLRTICKHDTTDVILLLQKAFIHDDQQYADNPNLSGYFGGYKIINHTKWSFLQPFEEKVLAIYTNSDSLLLEGFFGTQTEVLLYRACYTSGYLMGIKLAPYWNDTIRTYFDGPGRDLRQSSLLVKKNNWRAAGLVWNNVADGKKREQASKAAYNMALAWEHADQIEQSVAWLEFADSLSSNKHISLYKAIIEKRLAKQKLLDQQMQ